MIAKLEPPFEGIAAERFASLVRLIMRGQDAKSALDLQRLREDEVAWSRRTDGLKQDRVKYEAAARLLIDLAHLKWRVFEEHSRFELIPPTPLSRSGLSHLQIADQKTAVRREIEPLRAAQFKDKNVKKFIARLEHPPAKAKHKPISWLIADGRELYARLRSVLNKPRDERQDGIATAVKPYLQLVESDVCDEFTHIPLGEIWRYFRYTWSIPQVPIPGRQLFYLIRDGAHPCHAVMGITALSNSPLKQSLRDDFIGWTPDAFWNRIRSVLRSPDAKEQLEQILQHLVRVVDDGLEHIENAGLASPEEITSPTEEVIARLKRRSEEFAMARREVLSDHLDGLTQPIVLEEVEANLPPVKDALLELEGRTLNNHTLSRARRMLVAKKRAFELSRLLHFRLTVRRNEDVFTDPRRVLDLERDDQFIVALNAAMAVMKSARIGTNMLELTTCGAIPPYQHVLGGKLAALMMLSPQVLSDYRNRYGAGPAIISSQLKNAPRHKDATVVFLGTTSLYSVGSSQYERLKLPAGIIAPDQPEIRFQMVGLTSGYGTVQFSEEAVEALEKVVQTERGYKNINSIFGEGFSPRLRKVRAGFEVLGFDADSLLRHHQRRRVYAVALCNEALPFLLGHAVRLPVYIREPDKCTNASEKIAAFWRNRWLSARLDFAPAMEALAKTEPWTLSEQIASCAPERIDGAILPAVLPANDTKDGDVGLWKALARADSSAVCSDEMSPEDLKRLHVPLNIEEFVLEKLRRGVSIVLTGNAGDGKTHTIRRVKATLGDSRKVVFQNDATAAMRKSDPRIIIAEWKKARAERKPYCLAANEYPLWQLRECGRQNGWKDLPILQEVDRQCRKRLAYGPETADESALDRVIVVDLSLLNPLVPQFASHLLDRMLSDPGILTLAGSRRDENASRNHERLSHPLVKTRLLKLLEKLAKRGIRAPVRELWIILARLLFSDRDPAIAADWSARYWYSEKLFALDDRFALSRALSALVDPAAHSHPHWDYALLEPSASFIKGWKVAGPATTSDFVTLKRLFYFEHEQGDRAFALESEYAREYEAVLSGICDSDTLLVANCLEAINLAYCPKPFSGIEHALHLWIGHRFHEQPSRCFVSNQSIPKEQFSLLLPRVPRRIIDAQLPYQEDHFALRCNLGSAGSRTLLIDYSLFCTLQKLRAGLPRHLLPERDLNRLDAFMEALLAAEIPQTAQYISFNAEYRTTAKITMDSTYARYLDVTTYE